MTKLLLTHNHRTFPLASLALAFFVSLVVISPLLARAADLTTESVLALINSDRTSNNLSPLKLNEALSRAALAKADDMFAKGYFSHNSPKGETPWQWVKQSGYDYQSAGENLAINYASAEKQHTAWMKSTTHRANILNAKYQDTGIAIKTGKMNGEDVTVTVQLFGSPRGGATALPRVKTEAGASQGVPSASGLETKLLPTLVMPVENSTPAQATESLPAVQSINTSLSESRLPETMSWLPVSGSVSEIQAWIFLAAFILFASFLVALPTVFVGEAMLRLYRYWRASSQRAQAAAPTAPPTGRMLLSPGQFPPLLTTPKRRLV